MHFSTTTFLALAASASAHYNFDRLTVNGQLTEPYEYVRALASSQSNSPITDVTSNDIRCNNVAALGSTKTMQVKAGDNVGFTVRDVLGHPGPLFAYLSKSTTADVSTYTGDGDWFKVYEEGVKTFATDTTAMSWTVDNWSSFNFTLPTNIPNGQYLLRGEHIGIHGAGTLGGAQFYLSCAQIEVTGGTGGTPSPVGKFPGLYSATDPGILFQPYWPPVKNYTMPGPSVYGSSSGGGSPAPPQAPPAPPAPTSAAPTAGPTVGPATTSVAAPSTTLTTSTVPVPTGGGSTKPLPEGTTLTDLLAWIKIILNSQPAKRSETIYKVARFAF